MRLPAAILASLLCAIGLAQTTRFVPAQYPTLQAAVNACVNGDIVLVAPGSYPGVNFMGKAVTVQSSGGAAVTTITPFTGNPVCVWFVTTEGPSSILDGFTLLGYAWADRSAPTIRNCSWPTGGMSVSANSPGASAPSLTNCTFSNLARAYVGSTYSSPPTFATFTDCLFTNVTVPPPPMPAEGVVSVLQANATFIRCRFINNLTRVLDATGGAVSLVQCTITGNSMPTPFQGPYIMRLGLFADLNSCVIANNAAGAADVQSSTAASALVRGCTVWGNTLGVNIFWQATVANSILWNNGTFDLSAPHATVTYCNIGGAGINFTPGTGTISANPRFVDPASGDFHLAPLSPCRDAGGPISLTTTDLDGTSRWVGPVDIGPDEIPMPALPGTSEDLDLFCRINGTGDPLASSRLAPAGSQLTLLLKSVGWTFYGANAVVAAISFPTAGPPPGMIPGLPQVWLPGNVTFVIGGFPSVTTPLPLAGLSFSTVVPPGLGGTTFRLQGFVTTSSAANGVYAATAATEIVL